MGVQNRAFLLVKMAFCKQRNLPQKCQICLSKAPLRKLCKLIRVSFCTPDTNAECRQQLHHTSECHAFVNDWDRKTQSFGVFSKMSLSSDSREFGDFRDQRARQNGMWETKGNPIIFSRLSRNFEILAILPAQDPFCNDPLFRSRSESSDMFPFVPMCFHQGKKSIHHHRGPLFSRSVARPRGHRAKKAMVYTIFLGKQGKRVYTIGPDRRVYTIEPQTRKKEKKEGLHGDGVYFFLPCFRRNQNKLGIDPFCQPFLQVLACSPLR